MVGLVILLAAIAVERESPVVDEAAELKALSNRWVFSSGTWNGKKIEAEVLSELRFELGYDRLLMVNQVGTDAWSTGRFEINAATSPKQIQLFIEFDEHFGGKSFHGIYELNAGSLRVRLVPQAAPLPRDFTAGNSSDSEFNGTLVALSREQEQKDRLEVVKVRLNRPASTSDDFLEMAQLHESLGEFELARKNANVVVRMLAKSDTWTLPGDDYRAVQELLGRIALKQGDVAAARDSLLQMVSCPGFEPIPMGLATALLERDEKETVLEFLQKCREQSEIDEHQYNDWTNDIRAGRKPSLQVLSSRWGTGAENALSAIGGGWRFVSGQRGAKPIQVESFTIQTSHHGGIGRFRFQRNPHFGMTGTFSIDSNASPPTIDGLVTQSGIAGAKFIGIYKLENDSLMISAAPPGHPRPTQFVTPPESELLLFRFDRIARTGNRALEYDQEARLAIKELERATDIESRYWRMMDAAKLCLNAGMTKEAEAYAHEVLKLSVDQFQNNPRVHEGLHDGHLVLGRLAVRKGKIDEAKRHLLAMAPHVNQRGIGGAEYPDMNLAKELLELRETTAVLEYLGILRQHQDIAALPAKVDRWERDIRAGRLPDFTYHVNFDFENF